MEEQVHKDSKLGITTNVGTSVGTNVTNRLVKVIFTNIHKISDACANNFARYIIIAPFMRIFFNFY